MLSNDGKEYLYPEHPEDQELGEIEYWVQWSRQHYAKVVRKSLEESVKIGARELLESWEKKLKNYLLPQTAMNQTPKTREEWEKWEKIIKDWLSNPDNENNPKYEMMLKKYEICEDKLAELQVKESIINA